MGQTTTLLIIAILIYGCSAVLHLWSALGGTDKTKRAASAVAKLGLLVHTVYIVALGVYLKRAPVVNLFESLLILSWAIVLVYLIMERKYKIAALGTFVTLASASLLIFASSLPKGVNAALVPALRSQWSIIHVVSSLLGYAGCVLAFVAALGYAFQERMLKAKRFTPLQSRLPSLDVADKLAYGMVSFGFPMLTLGIVTGALWAQSAWNSYWSWDPKETWSLVTWLVYATYLHVRILNRWRGKWANRLLVVGFTCVVITYFGVNFLSSGLHRYNW